MDLTRISNRLFWKYLVAVVLLSISNLRLLWFLNSLSFIFFIVGECFIGFFLYFIRKNEERIQHFREDFVNYNKEFQKKVPLAAYELRVSLLFTFSMFVAIIYPSPLSVCFWMVMSLVYLILLIYLSKKKYEYREMLDNYYNFPGKESLPGKKSSRSMVTWTKYAGTACLDCVKYGAPVLNLLIGGGYMVPKLIYGFDFRPPMANFIGYSFTGLTSSSELIYGVGVKLTNTPQKAYLKAFIVGDDGHTIDPRKLLNEGSRFKLSKGIINSIEESMKE